MGLLPWQCFWAGKWLIAERFEPLLRSSESHQLGHVAFLILIKWVKNHPSHKCVNPARRTGIGLKYYMTRLSWLSKLVSAYELHKKRVKLKEFGEEPDIVVFKDLMFSSVRGARDRKWLIGDINNLLICDFCWKRGRSSRFWKSMRQQLHLLIIAIIWRITFESEKFIAMLKVIDYKGMLTHAWMSLTVW